MTQISIQRTYAYLGHRALSLRDGHAELPAISRTRVCAPEVDEWGIRPLSSTGGDARPSMTNRLC